MKPLLLHACCAPCSLEPVRLLREEGFEPTICWTNPNIQPRDEWQRRLDELRRWCADGDIELIETGEDRERWEAGVAPLSADRPRRCRACYALRLAEACRVPRSAGSNMWVRRSPSRRISCSIPAMMCLSAWLPPAVSLRSFAIFARITPRRHAVRASWACIGRTTVVAAFLLSRRPWTAPASATSAKPPKSSSFGTSAC